MPTPRPETETKTGTPVAPEKAPMPDPERHYQPQRLCPDQTKDGGWRARP